MRLVLAAVFGIAAATAAVPVLADRFGSDCHYAERVANGDRAMPLRSVTIRIFENGRPAVWVPVGYMYSTPHGYFVETKGLTAKYGLLAVPANTVPSIRRTLDVFLKARPQMGAYGQTLRANLVHITALECDPKTIR